MTKIYLSEELKNVLTHNDIDPDTGYCPAYKGESAGLDLFNCNDDIVVKPQTGVYSPLCRDGFVSLNNDTIVLIPFY